MTRSAQEQIEAIVGSLEADGPAAAPIDESLDLARAEPGAVGALALAVMDRFPTGGTFLDACFSLLPDDDWEPLITQALNRIEGLRSGSNQPNRNAAADCVIAYASMILPKSLHFELDRIFELEANRNAYYACYPWRESGDSHFAYLQEQFERNSPDGSRTRAWAAMLQTRDPQVVRYAIENSHSVEVPDYAEEARDIWLESHLNFVGFSITNGQLERTCPDSLYHVRFGESFFEDGPPAWRERFHPSWGLSGSETPAIFGGSSDGDCGLCRGRLHRLLSLDALPPGLGVTGCDQLELAACLSCVGWEADELFYEHNDAGAPASIAYEGETVSPEFVVSGLKQADVRLTETPRKWFWQDWGLSNGRENLNRVGGEPSWIQDSQYPTCPKCRTRMNFLMQLDSDLPTIDGDEWLWGSGGIGYGFWCDDCRVSAFLWQCT